MKKNYLLPGLFVGTGIVILGIGLMQFFENKIQTNRSLTEAKAIVQTLPKDQQEIPNTRFLPNQGDTTGLLVIPTIDAELPIIEGTDPEELEKGVGHYKGSFYPSENGQIVLSGHRDTVFRKAGELEIADSLEVQMPYGSYQYEITHTKVVPADDTSIITLQDNEEELILTTCYPFSYIGNAPDRYIIYAKRVETENRR